MFNTVVRQKMIYEKICDFKTNGSLFFPREDINGNMYVVANTGEVFTFNEGSSELIYSIPNGQPNGLCFDLNTIYVTDLNSSSVLFKLASIENGGPIENVLIKEFEDSPLKGPTSLFYDKDENILYMTDAGNFLESSLYPSHGSLFIIDLESKILRPILNSCLSFPADVVYDNLRKLVYVAETFANRVIRLTQNPEGVYHSSVYYQFNGRFGPTALAVDEHGNLYVARYDFQIESESEADGLISVLNTNGTLIGEMYLPKLAEITGLLISPKKKENLYVTERNSNGIMKVKLSSFLSEVDKIKSEEIKFN
jgi:sugar lactone lactonase YvrE